MVEIRYKGYYEVADLAGKSLADVRKEYQGKFDIPTRANARLNDKRIKSDLESELKLRDSDEIRFTEAKSGKGALMLGAMLLALAITGATFASGYLTNTASFTLVTAGSGDFASVSANTSAAPSWKVFGNTKGTTGGGTLFDVAVEDYTGDLGVTVSLANGDQLVKVYRVLNLFIKAYSWNGTQIDINSDNVVDSQDSVLLTLGNGEVNLYINQYSGSDNYTIKLDSGFYVSNVHPSGSAPPWPATAHQPILYANVSQR